jgi:hypothetical protein
MAAAICFLCKCKDERMEMEALLTDSTKMQKAMH